MQHSAFRPRTIIYSGFCRCMSYNSSSKRWPCCSFGIEWGQTVQHSTIGWYAGSCRCISYSASPEWWHCCCLWMQWFWTMQHSLARAWNSDEFTTSVIVGHMVKTSYTAASFQAAMAAMVPGGVFQSDMLRPGRKLILLCMDTGLDPPCESRCYSGNFLNDHDRSQKCHF